jgi:transposase-like protein
VPYNINKHGKPCSPGRPIKQHNSTPEAVKIADQEKELFKLRAKLVSYDRFVKIAQTMYRELPERLALALDHFYTNPQSAKHSSVAHSASFRNMVVHEYLNAPDGSKAAVSRAYGVSPALVGKWVAKYFSPPKGAAGPPAENPITYAMPDRYGIPRAASTPEPIPGTGSSAATVTFDPPRPLVKEELTPTELLGALFDDE